MPTTTRTREYRLSGTLDLVSVDRLADALSMALGASGDVVIDLSKVESIDSFVVLSSWSSPGCSTMAPSSFTRPTRRSNGSCG